MSSSKLPPYVLLKLPEITEQLYYPIKNIQRVKYTCFDVSKTLITFGATSGGIYIFNRNPCEFIQLIPNKDGPITRISISQDEKNIAFANGKGIVTVTECNQSLTSGPFVVTSKEHQGNEVTALVWSKHNLFTGDDVGKVSVLQMQGFIAKTMFHNSSQTIMSLDSRICQLDVKDCMLLVSTYTRCYICDTSQEQYRQIGLKLRDGEFGACFMNKQNSRSSTDEITQEMAEVKKFNIVDDNAKFAVSKGLENILIYCARPSSRLWEADIDGTVKRTHQFKQVLASKPLNSTTIESYNNESIIPENGSLDSEGQSVNFSKIFNLKGTIFSFKKEALYFLDIQDVDNTVWSDSYKDIIDCKFYNDCLYLWLGNGSLVNLRFLKIDKFLLQCYVDEKYVLCGKLCALYKDYLLTTYLSEKLHILVTLKDKLHDDVILESIHDVLDKFNSLKANEATQMKSGIYVVDNIYNAHTSLLEDTESTRHDENKFSEDALHALKELSVSVTDKLSSSKKILKEKWEDLKQLSTEKPVVNDVPIQPPKHRKLDERTKDQNIPIDFDINAEIIYKVSSHKSIEIDNNINIETDENEKKICKSLYQYFRLSLVGKEMEQSNLILLVEKHACDINQIFKLMLSLEQYCSNIGALEESKFVPNNIFLSYLNFSPNKDNLLDSIIKDENLYKYFVDSCISVNIRIQKLSNLGCECGFPLPFNKTKQAPVFSELIDLFIEKQWASQTKEQCYEICKRLPYLWRKIIYLRRNEDLQNILQILLQMLDENLLHSFLPQFTLESWDKAVQLFAILHANMCLNCNKKFENISVKDTLSWDDVGALIIKSVGGRNAVKIIEKHANLIDPGGLTLKFYHSSLLVAMYEQYDSSIASQLTDAIYSSYEFEDCTVEICNLLRKSSNGNIMNTALPLIVAAKNTHWGLDPITEAYRIDSEAPKQNITTNLTINEIIDKIPEICKAMTDCALCGLPLQNQVLIKDGGLWVFKCGHTFHGACLHLNKVKLCPMCSLI